MTFHDILPVDEYAPRFGAPLSHVSRPTDTEMHEGTILRGGQGARTEAIMARASDVMTHDVITVTPETTLRELAGILADRRINGVPVVDDDGAVIGVVCESDLVDQNRPLHIPTVFVLLDAVIPLEGPWHLQKEIKRLTASTVAEIYSHPAVCVGPETDLSEVAQLMAERKLYTIPVVERGKLVGVLGKADIIRSLT
jgi:CBS domain-containing protein